MTNSDSLQRFIFDNAPIRGELIHLEQSFQTIIGQHPYPASIRHLLGEALSVAGLLSAIIKFDGRLTVQFRGKGKLKLLLAQCNNKFQMRALVKWDGELSYKDLMDSFNEGVLVIMLDSEVKVSRYQGIVAWRGNSLAESIEGYFKDSEQLATKLYLGVSAGAAAGMLLQIIPGTEKQTSEFESEKVPAEWQRIIAETAHFDTQDLFKVDNETLLRQLYPKEKVRVFKPTQVAFQCTCTRKSGEDAIQLLGPKETEAELASKQAVVVTCDFCNKEYVFDRVDVAKIFADKDRPPTDIHLH